MRQFDLKTAADFCCSGVKMASVLSSNPTKGFKTEATHTNKKGAARAQNDGHLNHNISGGGDTVAKIIKIDKSPVNSNWPAPPREKREYSTSRRRLRLSALSLQMASQLAPSPCGLVEPAALCLSVCLPGRAFSHRPLPRELSPSLMSKWKRNRGGGIPLREPSAFPTE